MNITRSVVIGVVDVGAPKNTGWAITTESREFCGSELHKFISCFAKLSSGRPSTLGFECPLFLSIRRPASRLTGRRCGECRWPWSAGAGATVATVGTVLVTHVLDGLKTKFPHRNALLDFDHWPCNDDLLIFEAFVSGLAKDSSGKHCRDALKAANKFRRALPNLAAANCVTADDVLSLAGASMLRSGWTTDVSVLGKSCQVVRPEV